MSGILEVTFADGVRARARALHLRPTYECLAVGLPSTEVNRYIIKELPKEVRRVFGTWPVLILPATGPILHRSRRTSSTPLLESRLPALEFWCWLEAEPRTPKSLSSFLSVVWHQEKAYPFIAPSVLDGLKSVCWFEKAEDCDY